MKCSLGISNFLEEISSLSHSVVFLYFFALIAEEGFLILSYLAILWNSAFRCVYLSFSPLLFASLLFTPILICKCIFLVYLQLTFDNVSDLYNFWWWMTLNLYIERWEGWKWGRHREWGREGGSRGRGYMYNYCWFALLIAEANTACKN